MHIRDFRVGDETALHDVFHSAIHRIAPADYTPEQIAAWAPDAFDRETWTARMRAIRPFVVDDDGEIVGYADLQPSGYIDHFFVSGSHPRRGIGSMLMKHILEAAEVRGIAELTSDVSLTAQPLFERFGFVVVEQRMPVVRGVSMRNALMRRDMRAGRSSNAREPEERQ